MDMQTELLTWENNMMPYQMPSIPLGAPPGFGAFDPALYQNASMSYGGYDDLPSATTNDYQHEDVIPVVQKRHHSSSINRSPTSPSISLRDTSTHLALPSNSTSGEPSLEKQVNCNAQIVGISGESDPYLLLRYRYDDYNEANFQSIRMRTMTTGSDHAIPNIFTIQHNALASKAQPPPKNDELDRLRREVEDMVSEDVGRRLISLFYRYVQPYFPVLSHGYHDSDGLCQPSQVPTCVLAAIYGHALPFCAWDEKLCVEVYTPPSADALFRIAWLTCLPTFHTPMLSTLQTLLLLVQRRPTNKHVSDTPFKWVMMTSAVSIAQTLGLNRELSDWPIPDWEKSLRRRLAWATFVQDKWLALNFGRASHIQADDWDVRQLYAEDFDDAQTHSASQTPNSQAEVNQEHKSTQHFTRLCDLTEIVDDIMHELFSIRSTRALHNSLEATLEVAKPLRMRLTEWYQNLPCVLRSQAQQPASSRPSDPTSPINNDPDDIQRNHNIVQQRGQELNGNGSLHLAYITAKIELFRAMLRPQATDANAAAVTALRTGAVAVAREMLDFLDSLREKDLVGFWASYSRTNFTIASSFILLLFVSAPSLKDAEECLMLLNAWRALLRIKSRSCDLLNLALLRLDGVFVAGMEKLIELSPSAAQAWAEHGGGERKA